MFLKCEKKILQGYVLTEDLKMGILFCADYAHTDIKVLDFKNEIPIFI